MDLNEIINSIEDITDPFSMEQIIMYLDYVQELDQDFVKLLLEKLPFMEITWKQPWYQELKSLTRPKTVNGNDKENFRRDKITYDESKLIHRNWRKFCKHFNVPDNPECLARWKNTSKSRNPQTSEERVRRFVISYLARGLERTLHQVYRHVLSRYGTPIKGKYSLQEEILMEVCFYHNARNAIPILSTVLGREPRGIYKRMHEWLNGKDDGRRMKWDRPRATKFLNLLIEYTGLPLDELKNRKFDKSIWMKLEKDMKLPYIYLQKYWFNSLHVQIFVKKDVKINELRKRIAFKLQGSSYRVWTDIRWKELVKEFPDGFTDTFLYRIWATVVKKHKEYLKISLKELIEYALKRIPLLPNRRLKTLAINDSGELEKIRYKPLRN